MSGSVVINLFYRLFFIILTDFYINFKNEYKRMFSIKAYEIKKVQKLKVIFFTFLLRNQLFFWLLYNIILFRFKDNPIIPIGIHTLILLIENCPFLEIIERDRLTC